MNFDAILSPITQEDFLENYWEKTWLHISGERGRFADLMPWEQLNFLLENARLAPPLITLSLDGTTVEASRYIRTAPGRLQRIDVGKLMVLLAEGATVVLNMVEDLLPNVRALSRSVGETLQASVGINLYAGWKSQKGFDLHWDNHEVMVLQVQGRKRWQIFPPTQEHPLDAGVPPKPTGAPAWEGMLQEGDVLYLPRGWWHVAYPVDEPSLHLTIGVTTLNGLNLLNWMALRLRRNAALARKSIPVLGDRATRAAHMDQLRALVAATLNDTAVDDCVHEAADHAFGYPPLRLPQTPYDQLQDLAGNSLILLAAGSHLVFKEEGDMVSFNAAGKNYKVPSFVRPALALLNDRHPVSLATLCDATKDETAVANLKQGLAMLAQAGVILVQRRN